MKTAKESSRGESMVTSTFRVITVSSKDCEGHLNSLQYSDTKRRYAVDIFEIQQRYGARTGSPK